MSYKGLTSGVIFKTDGECIKQKEGTNGLKKIELKIKELTGYKLSYEKIKSNDKIPTGIHALSLLVMKQVLKWTNSDIFKLGYEGAQISRFHKLILRLMPSVDIIFNSAPAAWSQYHDTGSLDVVAKKKNSAIIRINNFYFNKTYCEYLRGYFEGTMKQVSSKAKCKKLNQYEFKITF